MGDKADEHSPDAPMPAQPGKGNTDLGGGPGDTPSRPDGAVLPDDSEEGSTEEGLGDIAAEVRARVEAGEGRDESPEYGSEGALGKPETGEW